MRGTLMYSAGDVRVENVPDPTIKQPTDALVRITASCICGSDLWPYATMKPDDGPARMGHEFIGVVADTGSEVTTVKRATWSSPRSPSPTAPASSVARLCRPPVPTPRPGSGTDSPRTAAQAEAIRVPLADGTLVKLPVAPDSALMPSLLTLRTSSAPATTWPWPASPPSAPASL